MYLCYIDESGTPDVPGNTSHYILAGVAIPISAWRDFDREMETIKDQYHLGDREVHVAWMMRAYPEQNKIANFEKLNYSDRRHQVTSYRAAELLRLQRTGKSAQYRQTRKNYDKTNAYIHLTHSERKHLILALARKLADEPSARLFAECVDKLHFDPNRVGKSIDEQALEGIVWRFDQFLQNISHSAAQPILGLMIHDNNETVAKKHTLLMKRYLRSGILWRGITNLVETPLFVNSELTGMVQIADLCGYAMRRYLENGEDEVFDLVFQRADRTPKDGTVVGVRHFTKQPCSCRICEARRKSTKLSE